MFKRVLHCLTTAILCAIIAAILAIAMPHEADAIPVVWRGTPQFTQKGVTYQVRGWKAVVVKTHGKEVKIPAEVKYRGRWYEVRQMWSTSLKGATKVVIHAELEGCDAWRLWRIKKVYVTHEDMYNWLKEGGAHVKLISCEACDGCK